MSTPTLPLEAEQPRSRGHVECREAERLPCGRQTSCQPLSLRGEQDARWPATIQDVSVRGIGLVLLRRFEPGAGLFIELPENGDSPGYNVLARVVRAMPQEGGYWVLGCTFVSELSEEELAALTRSGRCESSEAAEISAAKDHIEGVILRAIGENGLAIRRLVKHLALTGTWPLAPGKVITARVGQGSGPNPPAKLRVDRCERRGAYWVLDCTFLQTPSAAVLHSFGASRHLPTQGTHGPGGT